MLYFDTMPNKLLALPNSFVFHPILMKLGEVVVSKSDEKQKSFDYSTLVLALWKVLTLWHCVKVKQHYLFAIKAKIKVFQNYFECPLVFSYCTIFPFFEDCGPIAGNRTLVGLWHSTEYFTLTAYFYFTLFPELDTMYNERRVEKLEV